MLCQIGCRKISVILSGFSAIIYFLFIDDALSSHFFRIWFIVFPPIFIAVADVTTLYLKARPQRRWVAVIAVILIGLTGIIDLRPREPVSTKAVTLPPGALTETHYLVNSGFIIPKLSCDASPTNTLLECRCTSRTSRTSRKPSRNTELSSGTNASTSKMTSSPISSQAIATQ